MFMSNINIIPRFILKNIRLNILMSNTLSINPITSISNINIIINITSELRVFLVCWRLFLPGFPWYVEFY